MKAALTVLSLCAMVLPAFAQAPPDVLARGEQVYTQSCTGYCHAPKGGAGGGAPRLAARGLDQVFINNVVTRGIPETPMQGFAATLSRADLAAVVAYVASINDTGNASTAAGGSGVVTPPGPTSQLSADISGGRDFFYDATRGVGRCSTCHMVAGLGIPVAVISRVPDTVAALRALATPAVSTITRQGERMPGLVVNGGPPRVLFYDLTTAPPVFVTADPSTVTVAGGSTWRHATAIGSYKDDELESILRFLRATR